MYIHNLLNSNYNLKKKKQQLILFSFINRNYAIEYLPVPITDIILMRMTDKERQEKVPFLINKVIIHNRIEF